jgi:hypothetical protein
MEITRSGRNVDFDWIVSEDSFEITMFGMAFENGALYVINDRSGLFTIGGAEVTVSEEEAIEIAMNNARDFYWVTGEGISVKADSIPRELAMPELSWQHGMGRDPFTYYPYWHVDLWLDKTYPGGVSYISVGMWADTGEVVYVKALGGGGGILPYEGTGTSSSANAPSQPPSSTIDPSAPSEIGIMPNETPSPQQQPNDAKADPTGNYPLAAVAAAATISAAATLYLKKRRRQHR